MARHFTIAVGLVAGLALTGCVSSGTHEQTLAELSQAKTSAARQAEADKARLAELAAQIATLEKDKSRAANDLLAAQTALSKNEAELSQAKMSAEREEERSRQLRDQLIKAQEEHRQIQDLSGEVRRERDALHVKADDLQRQLDTVRQDHAAQTDVLNGTLARVAALGKTEQNLTDQLTSAHSELRNLTTKLEAEHAQIAALQEDKQRLLGGTTTAQSEIARLQKRAGELETEAARAKDLEHQLAERNQEVGQLRHSLADRDTVAAALATQGEDLKRARERVDQLTKELSGLSEEAARLKQDRDALSAKVDKAERDAAALTKDKNDAVASLEAQQKDLLRLAQEKAAKEAEIKRLAGTYEDLASSLRSEIAQGNVKIKQVRDRLTINVVDRILFDSGSTKVKPAGLKVLKQVGDVLKTVTDKQIRIEGHTDNVPIGVGLKDRFPTNWELSTARATSVVRYLIDEGGVASDSLSAAGFADTKPVASNEAEEGRSQNRRIEIALYPKDLKGIAEGIQ